MLMFIVRTSGDDCVYIIVRCQTMFVKCYVRLEVRLHVMSSQVLLQVPLQVRLHVMSQVPLHVYRYKYGYM